MKKIVFLLLIPTVLSAPHTAFAQLQTDSQTVTTRVGNPAEGYGDLVTVGLDIKAAYDVCSDGYTYEYNMDDTCLAREFTNLGYSDAQAATLVEHSHASSGGSGLTCVECLGYVSIAVALAHNYPVGLRDGSTNCSLVASPSFSVGGTTYRNIGSGIGVDAQSGDIAITCDPSPGHIFIVKDSPSAAIVTALESNAGYSCRITDNGVRPKSGYTFFRRS
jgi:hypothetical protein